MERSITWRGRDTEDWRVAGAVGERVRSATATPQLLARRRLAERTHLVGVVRRPVAEQAAQVPRLAVRRVTALRVLTHAVPVRIGALVTTAEQHHSSIVNRSLPRTTVLFPKLEVIDTKFLNHTVLELSLIHI